MSRILDRFSLAVFNPTAKTPQNAAGGANASKPALALAGLLIALVSSAVAAAPVTVVPGSPAAYIFFPRQLNP